MQSESARKILRSGGCCCYFGKYSESVWKGTKNIQDGREVKMSITQLYMRLTKMPITQLYIIVSIFVVTILFLSYLFFKRKHKKEKKEKGKK